MRYYNIINDKLVEVDKESNICLLSKNEFSSFGYSEFDSVFVDDFTKIDTLLNYYNINLTIPFEDYSNNQIGITIILAIDKLFIIDDTNFSYEKISKILNLSSKKRITSYISFLGVYFLFLLEHQFAFLESVERKFQEIEESALDDKIDTFHKETIKIRKKLIDIENFYEQLEDVCLILIEDDNSFFEDIELRYIEKVIQRIKRLDNHLKGILDYGNQVREFCQTQVDIKLNKVMKILTSVTAVSLPFTIVAGWYGMNFENMPELKNPIAYALVFGITSLVSIILIVIFWKKKYF